MREMTDIIAEQREELLDLIMEEEDKRIAECEIPKSFKIKMNRMGREKIGLKNALHPEVDNAFERMRSKIVRWWYKRKK